MKKQNELISVIVPVYNVEAYLDRCVESLVAQTYKNIEIILVDDGSPDNCPAICDKWAAEDDRIHVIHKENGGLSDARNVGLKDAKGDWVMFVDSDDWVNIRFCETALAAVQKTGAGIGAFSFAYVHPEDTDKYLKRSRKKPSVNRKNGPMEVYSTEAAMAELSGPRVDNYAWNKIYMRQVFDNVQWPQGRLFEDIGTAYRLIDQVETVVYTPEELYYYLQNSAGIVSNVDKKSKKNSPKARKAMKDIFEQFYDRYQFFLEKYPAGAEAMYDRLLCEAVVCCIYNIRDDGAYDKALELIRSAKGMPKDMSIKRTLLFYTIRRSEKMFRLICKLFDKG